MSSKWSRALERLFGGITTNNNGYGYNNNGYNNNGGYYGAQPQALPLVLKNPELAVFHSYIFENGIWVPKITRHAKHSQTQWECRGKIQVSVKLVHDANEPATSMDLFCVWDPKTPFDYGYFFDQVYMQLIFNALSGDGTQMYARDLTTEELRAVPILAAPQGPHATMGLQPPMMMMYGTPPQPQPQVYVAAQPQPQQPVYVAAQPPPPPTNPQWTTTTSIPQAVLVPTLYPPKQV